uniref:Uncharacterized protein n=1 Tax=Manihot esculenta TaxID=3983 RepID=A0A199UCD4_MANES
MMKKRKREMIYGYHCSVYLLDPPRSLPQINQALALRSINGLVLLLLLLLLCLLSCSLLGDSLLIKTHFEVFWPKFFCQEKKKKLFSPRYIY